MNLDDFKALSMDQQLLKTHRSGVFLTVIKTGEHVIRLYALEKFFVEIWYSTKKDEVEVSAFQNTEWLEAYVTDIELKY